MYALQLAFDPDQTAQRLELRDAHREAVGKLTADGKILAAGPWGDDSGALLVFLVDTEQEARDLMDADPYYTGPGVTVVGLWEWNTVARSPLLDVL